MADLSIEVMQQCKPVDTNIDGYEQTTWPFNSCSCKGFEVKKNCKHLKQAIEEACDYHEQFDGAPETDGVCPKCGNETEYVKVGV